MYTAKKKIQIVIVLLFLFGAVAWFSYEPTLRAQQSMSGGGASSITPWRPNKKGVVYTGPQACAKCHKEESAHQHGTAMGRALEPTATSEILRSNPRMSFRSGSYTYQITRDGTQSIYSVTDGKNTISVPILYSFGQGKAGQTYVFQYNGSFYESRLSFYKEIKGLDFTIGYTRDVPPSLNEALGRAISMDEARSCFTCHSTAATNGSELQLDRMIPGVSCEACHGPGADHIVAMEAKKLQDKKIFNPGKMDPDEMTQEFCGSCHRSALDVAANKSFQGINSLRFQPYRMFTSRGHDPFDPRLSCTACHDVHKDVKVDLLSYDANCFSCHRSGESLKSVQIAKTEEENGRTAKACPVGKQSCVSCHMPKIEIPGSHFQFTDHRIRIARTGEPFPN